MSQFDDLKAALASAQTSLDGITADIQALKDAIKPGMTEAEANEAVALVTALQGRLAALDLENPAA